MKKAKRPTGKDRRNRKIMAENKQNFIMNLKAQVGCEKCDIDNPVILLLHHIKPRIRTKGSGRPSGFNWLSCSWPAIMKELEKCTVLCLNHHGLEHEKITGEHHIFLKQVVSHLNWVDTKNPKRKEDYLSQEEDARKSVRKRDNIF